MGFGGDRLESGLRQPRLDVVLDVVPEVGLVEDPPEILHHHGELRRIVQLHRIRQHQHATGLQHPLDLVEHGLPCRAGQFMQQEHAGGSLQAGLGEGQRFGIALDQLGQLARQLGQPAIGLPQVSGGGIEPINWALGRAPRSWRRVRPVPVATSSTRRQPGGRSAKALRP